MYYEIALERTKEFNGLDELNMFIEEEYQNYQTKFLERNKKYEILCEEKVKNLFL